MSAATFGGGAGYTVNRRLRVFGEGYQFRKTLEEFRVKVKTSATGFQGGVHILFPIGKSRAVPFAAASFGVGTAKASVGNVSVSETLGQFGFGGGLDYYVSPKWGLRPEVRVFNVGEVRATMGVFYRF